MTEDKPLRRINHITESLIPAYYEDMKRQYQKGLETGLLLAIQGLRELKKYSESDPRYFSQNVDELIDELQNRL